jgi:hypothetical protein
MTLDEVKNGFPALAAKLPGNIFTDRELVVVDHNYLEEDGEEAEEFDSNVYNHIIYIAVPTLEIIGESGLAELGEMLENFEQFERFVASEEDLFGVYTDLDEDGIAKAIFGMLEVIVS